MRLASICVLSLSMAVGSLAGPRSARADLLTLDLSGPSALTGGATIHDVFNTAVGDSIQALVADIGNNQTDVVQIYFGGGPNGPPDYGNLLFANYYPPTALAPGSYPDASRFGAQGQPALDVSFRSSEFNTSTGSFDITKIDLYRDSTNTLQLADFSATFLLQGDNLPGVLTGSVVYVSSAVPEPSPLALLGIGLACLAGWCGASRRRSVTPAPIGPPATV